MRCGDALPDDFTPCDRCGWPVDDADAVTTTTPAGTTRVLHSFCVRRRVRGGPGDGRRSDVPD